MIRLSNRIPQTLQLITTQNGADVSVSYSDNTNTQSGGTQNSLITSATTSTICATPPLLNQTYEVVRSIDRISILNTFNGTHTITVQIGEGSASYPLLIVTLNYQDALIFNDNTGWQVLDSSGNLKTVLGPTSALNIHNAPNKTTPVAADEVGIWDSVTGLLGKVTWANIVATIWAAIHTATNKTTPVGADEIGIWDSATGLLNKVSFTNMLNWFAALAGSASQVFSVAAATLGTHAMNRDTADARYQNSVQGGFKNLQASATGTTANVTVTADEVVLENSTNLYQTVRSVSLTIAGTAAGANGLDAGTIAASTWYSIWVIWNGTTIAGLMSTSATAPTLPGGYTHKARVGWVRTDGTANKYPLGFTQKGKIVRYLVAAGSNVTAPPIMTSGTGTLWTAVAWANFAPSTASRINVSTGPVAVSSACALAPNSSYTATNAPFSATNVSAGGSVYAAGDLMLESANIYYYNTSAGQLNCYGWEDNL